MAYNLTLSIFKGLFKVTSKPNSYLNVVIIEVGLKYSRVMTQRSFIMEDVRLYTVI